MKLIYEGTNSPAMFASLPVGPDVTEAQLETMYTAGRGQSVDYNIIIQDTNCRRYWYPAPSAPAPAPKILSWAALAFYLVGLLGGGAPGRAALGSIIGACQAAASTGADKFFAVYFQGQSVFSKTEFTTVLSGVSNAIVDANAKLSVANNWPVA